MYECEIGQGLLGNSVARAMGGAVARFRTPRFQFPDFVPDFRISYPKTALSTESPLQLP